MTATKIQGSKIQVLLVEDDYIIASALEIMINSLNMHVMKRVTSAEASILEAFQLKPDLIIMDIILEGKMNGIEAASIINQKTAIPIIFLTGYWSCPSKTATKENYVFEVIQKPLTDINDFLTVVKKIFGDYFVPLNKIDLLDISVNCN